MAQMDLSTLYNRALEAQGRQQQIRQNEERFRQGRQQFQNQQMEFQQGQQMAGLELGAAERQRAAQEAQFLMSAMGQIDPQNMTQDQLNEAWTRGVSALAGARGDVQGLPQVFDPGVYQQVAGLAQLASGQDRNRVGAQEILADGTVIQSTNQGVRVLSPSGEVLTGPAAEQAVRRAREFEAENQRSIYTARESGTRGTRQSLDVGKDAFDKAREIRSSLGLFDEAVAALDAGAQTGAIASYFPTITNESKRLENIQRQLGLSIIQTTTFGALSEAEMRLAMEVAVPTGLDEAELRQWLIDKRDAQRKAAEALENAAAELLSGRATLADLAQTRVDQTRQEQQGDTGGGSVVNWSDL